jgi:molybdopterin-guanine dinucleotide biosynthesis protein A
LADLIGIVLMGGKSSRMGIDKSQLIANTSHTNETQKNFAQLAHTKLKCYVTDVFYSINQEQKNLHLNNTIIDEYPEEGPLSGIISALRFTQTSIVVLGVDVPLVTKQSIKNIIVHRNWDLLTTTYYNTETRIWEPMLSIWEIETLPCLEEYFTNGGRSIQQFLNQYGNQRVQILDVNEFTNVNTPEEYEHLRAQIG